MRSGNCIYCGRRADSRDHVPSRCLLERPYPEDLRTVPACSECNNGFSLDEQYFLVVLAQIATSPILTAKVDEGGSVDRALERSPGLDARIIKSLKVDEEGRVLIEPENDRIFKVVAKTGAGLFYLRYGRPVDAKELAPVRAYPYNLQDQRPWPLFVNTFSERFLPKRWTRVQQRVFSYIVVRDLSSTLWCIMDFYETLWGVVRFPHPKSAGIAAVGQIPLFEAIGRRSG